MSREIREPRSGFLRRTQRDEAKRRRQFREVTVGMLRYGLFEALHQHTLDREVARNLRALARMAPVLVDLLKPVRRRAKT